jgi:hypothetical protein
MISAEKYINSISQKIKEFSAEKRKIKKIILVVPDLEVAPITRKWNSVLEFTTKTTHLLKHSIMETCSCCYSPELILKFYFLLEGYQIFFHKTFLAGAYFYDEFKENLSLKNDLLASNIPQNFIDDIMQRIQELNGQEK